MFDNSMVHLIEGTDIDCLCNAITLTHNFHQLFGNFEVFFEPQSGKLHTYRIDLHRWGILYYWIFPIDCTLFLTNTWTIDSPSLRLLAVHSAITHILYLSAAGRHINKILKDLNQKEIKADGSTELEYLAQLRVHGWWNRQICAYWFAHIMNQQPIYVGRVGPSNAMHRVPVLATAG